MATPCHAAQKHVTLGTYFSQKLIFLMFEDKMHFIIFSKVVSQKYTRHSTLDGSWDSGLYTGLAHRATLPAVPKRRSPWGQAPGPEEKLLLRAR